MKPVCALLLVAGICRASVIPLHSHAVLPSASQVRIQDELGQYHFEHAGGPNSRSETRTADGVTRGGYSYVDGNGLVQSAAYVSDPVNGFRVAATNLPSGPAVPAGDVVLAAAPQAVVAPVVAQVAPSAILATPGIVGPSAIVQTGPAIVGPVAGGVTIQGAVEGDSQVVVAEAKSAEPAPVSEASEAPSSTPAPEVAPASEAIAEDSAAVEAAPAPAPVNPYLPVQDTPEVLAARAQHLAAVQEAQARDSASGTEASTDEPTETPETPEPSEAPSTAAPAPEAPSTAAPEEPALIPAAVPAVRIAGPLPPVSIASVGPVAAVAAPAIAHVASVAAPSVAPVAGVGPVVGVVPPPALAVAPVAVAPAVAVADAAQYRVQDELGQYAFGHIGGPNAREEVKTVDGITRGGYTYVDGNGLVQSAAYVSDPVNGFRVAATNIPLQPAPTYIPDSPEVAEAKAALFKAQAEHIAKL